MSSSHRNKIDEELVDIWLEENHLDAYGCTMYEATPFLFDEKLGASKDRIVYLEEKFPTKPWLRRRAPRG